MDDNELRALAHRVRERVENGVDVDAGLKATRRANDGRQRTRPWLGIAVAAAAAVFLLAAVSLVTRNDGTNVLQSSEPTSVEVSTPGTATNPATTLLDEARSTSDEPDPPTTSVPADPECAGPPSGDDFSTGGFGTVPAAPNAASVSVSISPQVPGGCPSGEASVTVDLTNTGTEAVTFASDLGILLSAGRAKWPVGVLEEMTLAPGESATQDVSILIPTDVAAGSYSLLVGGYEASAPFVVYQTTDPHGTPPSDLFESVSPTVGAPAAFATTPDGYRPVLVDKETRPTGSSTTTWSATFVENPRDDEQVKPYLIAQIEVVVGDPYDGFPGLVDTPEVTLGQFTGRIASLAPGHPVFVVVLDESRRLTIGGRTDETNLGVVAEGLVVEADGLVGGVGSVPDGYELIDQRSINTPSETTQWDVGYAREQLIASMVVVRATVNPDTPAANQLLAPTPTAVVDINGYAGYLGFDRVIFDVSPNYQIELSREIAITGPPLVSNDELLRLARTIVPISDEEFNDIAAVAAQNPLTPTDNPCTFYVRASNPVSTPEVTRQPDGRWITTAPGSFTMDISTTQPMSTITVALTSLASSELIPLAVLEDPGETTTVEVTWDGTIDGETAPPGDYYVSLQATPADNNTPGCTADTATSRSTSSTEAAFRVT